RLARRRPPRRRLRLLERSDLFLQLRDARLELVDATHLLGELVHTRPEVVDGRECLLSPRKVRDALQRLLAGVREPRHEVLLLRSHLVHAAVIPFSVLHCTDARTAASVSPAPASILSNARSSCAVGPRFTITSDCASSGRPPTGQTSSDDPTTSISRAPRASCTARSIAPAGSTSPKRTMPGLSGSPHCGHAGTGVSASCASTAAAGSV